MQFSELLPITQAMYSQMSQIAWLMIAPMFLLSCVVEYAKEPHNFPATLMLRKLILTAILISIFPQIANLISNIGKDVADKISERHAIQVLYDQLNAQTNPKNQLNKFPFLIAEGSDFTLFNYASFAIAHLAKPLMILACHVLWSLNLVIAPLILLFNLFPGASQVPKHLFRSMIEISCWNIVWQILGEMLLGVHYIHELNNYFDVIGFNFFLGLMMIGTPFIVHSFVGRGLSTTALVAPSIVSVAAAPIGKVARAVRAVNQTRRNLNRGDQS